MTRSSKKKSSVVSALKGLSDWELVDVWNGYCKKDGDPKKEIFDIAYFDDKVKERGLTPTELANRCALGEYSPHACFFYFDDLGLVITFFKALGDYSPISLSKLADAIIEKNDAYGNDIIAGVLEKYGN